jgi:hypothetical protein
MRRGRAIKRSVTIQPEIDAAVVRRVGTGEYSRFTNGALLMALQAEGILETMAAFERKHGALTAEDYEKAKRSEDAAVRRARRRKR